MRAVHLVARGFRNLADLELELPPAGGAFLGPNGQGKTNLLEALYYPVLWRSFRGATDADLARWDGPGFHVAVTVSDTGTTVTCEASYLRAARRKRVRIDGSDAPRLVDAVGHWVAAVFVPGDVGLVQGAGAVRRQYLDRVLSLTDRTYLQALLRYRGALAQRNAAFRQGQPALVKVFGEAMAPPGAEVMRRRLAWVEEWRARFAAECSALGESVPVALSYRGRPALADPEGWAPALAAVADREQRQGVTLVGPQRDDLLLTLDGRSLRDVGSTGQQRTAAVALKLCELASLGRRGESEPVLLLDDVFAELDRDRQERLAARLAESAAAQVFVTAPRQDEMPPGLALPVFRVEGGEVRHA